MKCALGHVVCVGLVSFVSPDKVTRLFLLNTCAVKIAYMATVHVNKKKGQVTLSGVTKKIKPTQKKGVWILA